MEKLEIFFDKKMVEFIFWIIFQIRQFSNSTTLFFVFFTVSGIVFNENFNKKCKILFNFNFD